MDSYQRRVLGERCDEAIRRFPSLARLRQTLLSHGGEEMVIDPFAPQINGAMAEPLLMYGKLFSGRVRLRKIHPNRCHENAAILFLKKPQEIAIGTGWGLSADGLWRAHSWALDRSGLIETTTKRLKYFGIEISGASAEAFAKMHQ
jgi:hypothetical protein